MRWLAVIAAVLVLAGCGAGTSGQPGGAPIVPDTPAPPISAADEAPPDDIAGFLQMDFSQDDQSGRVIGVDCAELVQPAGAPADTTASCPQPSPEDQAKLAAQMKRYDEALRPAAGSAPRVVAKLAIGQGSMLFTAWTTSSGALCWETDEESPDGSGGGGPSGPCVRDAQAKAFSDSNSNVTANEVPCDALCLESDGSDNATYLTGTVPADADALRITDDAGTVATYPLVGPRVLDTDTRVFMLGLGEHDWRKLELIRRGAVAQTVTMPALTAAYEDCTKKLGPMPMPPKTGDEQAMLDAVRPYETQLQQCVHSTGVETSTVYAHP